MWNTLLGVTGYFCLHVHFITALTLSYAIRQDPAKTEQVENEKPVMETVTSALAFRPLPKAECDGKIITLNSQL